MKYARHDTCIMFLLIVIFIGLKGIVTRRPLVLQLHKTEGGADYAEFLHAPKKRFTDFGMLNFWNVGFFSGSV